MAKKKGQGGKGASAGGAGGGGGGGGGSPNQTILLLQTGGSDPKNLKLAAAKGSKVRWDNQANRGLTVTFQYWPFVEAPVPIAVEAGKKTKWFNTVVGIAKGAYSYMINPDLTVGDTPPDPPGVSFNG